MSSVADPPRAATVEERGASVSRGRGIVWCALAGTCDGIDAQAMALVATHLMAELHLTPAQLGLALGAAPLGMVVGALAAGPAADRYGRRPTIIAALACVGAFSTLIAFAASLPQLIVLRLLAGIGMGGVVSTVITLSAELSAPERRARNVALVFSSVPLGAMVAAMLAVVALDALGWRALYLVYGALPLLVTAGLLRWLPESPVFRAVAASGGDRVRRSARSLLGRERRAQTLLVWTGLVLAFQATYFLSFWLPTLLERGGFAARAAISTLIGLNAGAVVGGLALGLVMRRRPARQVVPLCYLGASLAALGAAAAHGDLAAAVVAIFLLGVLTLGGQVASASLIASLYPASIRGAGVGWATGMGRVGAVTGPAVGGLLLSAQWTPGTLLAIVAGVQLCVAVLLWIGPQLGPTADSAL